MPNFIQIYWWLRSPHTNNTNGAYYVRSSGYVDYNGYGGYSVRNSYGVSPSMIYDDNACFVMPSGKAFGYLNTYVYDSYGCIQSPVTYESDNTWQVDPSGNVFIGYTGVYNSYGSLSGQASYE